MQTEWHFSWFVGNVEIEQEERLNGKKRENQTVDTKKYRGIMKNVNRRNSGWKVRMTESVAVMNNG
jgi:hypothetical protein